MKKEICMATISLMMCACNQSNQKTAENNHEKKLPNIVYILADDMGYGDVSVNNPESKINTPYIDQLASEGMRFTDAHAPSSVCTPSRYGILTGRYCWRSRLPQGVLQGYGRALIEKDQLTIGTFLQQHDYETAAIGKWHLGLNWVIKDGYDSVLQINENDEDHAKIIRNIDDKYIDVTKPVTDGPREHGFDYSYILPASLDMQPYCYLQNDTLTAPLNGYIQGNEVHPKDAPNYAIGAFWRAGLMAEGFDFSQVLPNFTNHVVNYIQQHAQSDKPFFLYFPMPAPHTPWLPSKEFAGKSKAGKYGDYVMMVDAMVGKVLDAINKNGLSDNTLIIFASDNGPYWRPNFIEKYNHRAAYIFRGMKADAWEGGHRIPFIVKWDGKIKAGSVSHVTTTLTNLVATCSELISGEKTVASAIDSYSILPVLLGNQNSTSIPQTIVNESSHGLFAVRKGSWKLIKGRGSGGFSAPVTYDPKPGEAKGQLYDLEKDASETTNLYLKDSQKVNELNLLIDSIMQLK